MDKPEDREVLAKLQEANAGIVEENKARHFPDAMLDKYTIDVGTFIAIFENATPCLLRLRGIYGDVEARTNLTS